MRSRRASPRLTLNPRVAEKIASAALIIYGPGTQHSSLFPSYLTAGLGEAIAQNLAAMKVLVTNIQPDAEITGSNAVGLLERAVYFLRAKGTSRIPTPFLITHSLLNDPSVPEATRPYVPLGPTDTIEDPRLVRIGNYEDGVTGRHHAARVLEPFIASIVSRRERRRVAVLLSDTDSLNKVTQTLLEMVRGGIEGVPLDVTVFYTAPEPLDAQARRPAACRSPASSRRRGVPSARRRAIAASITSCSSNRQGCIAARRRCRSWRSSCPAGSMPCGAAAGSRCATSRSRTASATARARSAERSVTSAAIR